MFFVSLGVYFLAFALLLLSLISERTTERKLKDASKFFALEIGFAFMVFSLNNIVTSIVMEYQSDVLLVFKPVLNKILMAVVIIMVLAHSILFILFVHDHSDSTTFYHRHKNHTHYFPIVLVIRNIALMTAILLEQLLGEISTHICLGVEAAYLVSIIIARPYRKIIDYFRFGVV